jgi:hypothetical protein
MLDIYLTRFAVKGKTRKSVMADVVAWAAQQLFIDAEEFAIDGDADSRAIRGRWLVEGSGDRPAALDVSKHQISRERAGGDRAGRSGRGGSYPGRDIVWRPRIRRDCRLVSPPGYGRGEMDEQVEAESRGDAAKVENSYRTFEGQLVRDGGVKEPEIRGQ